MDFQWTVGAEASKLSLEQPTGGDGSIQIMLDNYYQGQIVLHQNEWLFYLNSNSSLTGFEILTLRDVLDNKKPG